jgi:hypothetical protein
VHGIELLNRCLQLSIGSAARRRQWGQDILTAKTNLAALYIAGLDPAFLTAPELRHWKPV